jgi:RimJ/RimL family protein N-acetyltransferase
MSGGAPYRIETARLVLRCASPEDAAAIADAENASRADLRRFMPWADRDPETLDETAAKLRLFRSRFDRAEDFVYFAFDRATGACTGGIGLHARVGQGGLEIGYWVDSRRHRQRLATEMTGAVTRVAIELLGCRWVEIRCAPENVASAGVPKKLGFVHEATLHDRFALPGGVITDALVFTLLVKDYAASGARAVDVAAFDAVGRRVLG